jgi:hypothetical protein
MLGRIREYVSTNRWSLHFSASDIFNIMFTKAFVEPLKKRGLLWCCSNDVDPLSESQRKVEIFDLGKEKVMQELDCISLLNRMKSLEQLTSLLLSHK